jgi:hypothetical protein
MKRLLMGMAALSVVVAAGLAGGSILERNRFIREIEFLRTDLHQTRFSVDSCKMALVYQEQGFLLFDALVDSLHAEVRTFEDPSRGGVPEARYPEYLEVFDLYNDSVAVWQDRADSLQTSEATCRSLIEWHNLLSDSLRGRLQARRSDG